LRLNPVAAPAQGTIGSDGRTNAPEQPVKPRITFLTGLHDHLEFGAVLIVMHKRRQRHGRLAGVSIAQDHQPRRRDPFW